MRLKINKFIDIKSPCYSFMKKIKVVKISLQFTRKVELETNMNKNRPEGNITKYSK